VPFIQKTSFFAKNLLEWDGDPGQIPTKDKNLYLGGYICTLENKDPLMFL